MRVNFQDHDYELESQNDRDRLRLYLHRASHEEAIELVEEILKYLENALKEIEVLEEN